MKFSDPKIVALLFNKQINNQDLNRLTNLMTKDHTFIDSEGDVDRGREEMKRGWREFFKRFPDYENIFYRVESRGNLVIMLGHSECSYKPLHGPAIWTAKIKDDLVSEWRVYSDNEENRKKLCIL
ncbi:MAG: nuclear transport factor 2 family protein [Candidatus Methanofastidiosia archaeon]